MSVHAERFKQAGYDFSPAMKASRGAARRAGHDGETMPCTVLDAYGRMKAASGNAIFIEQAGGRYTPPNPPIPRKCDHCDRVCTAECRCGETYCDKNCQAAEWANHKEICEICFDNQELGMKLNAMVWGRREIM